MKENLKKVSFLLILTFALSACASLGLTSPQTPEDKIQYTRANVASVYKSITLLATSGRITKAAGQKLIADADSVNASLSVAQMAMVSGDANQVDVALASALALLQTLQASLKTK